MCKYQKQFGGIQGNSAYCTVVKSYAKVHGQLDGLVYQPDKTYKVVISAFPALRSPALLFESEVEDDTLKIQAASPHPTTTSSAPFASGRGSGFDELTSLALSLSVSIFERLIQSARAFHTPAMSPHLEPGGWSVWLNLCHSMLLSEPESRRFDRMILMPFSLTQRTYLPERDHLIVLIVPSPLCSTLSEPVFDPNPMDPSHPVAAAVALVVVAFVLRPAWPPVVNTKEPACPPER